jgi:GT2 family glycosyltransferase
MRILLSRAEPDDAAARHVRSLTAGLTARHHQVTVHSFEPMPELSEVRGARVVVGNQLADVLLEGGFDIAHLSLADHVRLGPWAYRASASPVVLTVSRPMAKLRVAGLAHVIFTSDAVRRQMRMVAGRPAVSVHPIPGGGDGVADAVEHERVYQGVVGHRRRGARRWLSAQLLGDRRRRSPAPGRPPATGPAVERLGVLVTSYCRPASLRRCIEGVATLPHLAAVCVVDNSPDPEPIERPRGLPSDVVFRVMADGVNHGQPVAVAMGWAQLAGTAAILVLDDDTVPTAALLTDLMAAMDPGTGVAALPDQYSVRYSAAGPPRLFAWSPSLIRTVAIEEVGPPRSELFFGHDDFEFSLRLCRAGWRVAWVPHQVAELHAHTTWPERHYFDVRNSVWLVTRSWPSALPLWQMAGDTLWMLGSMIGLEGRSRLAGVSTGANWRGARAGLVGLLHGVTGRMGPPPDWVLGGRDRP